MTSRSRGWCCTLNNYDEAKVANLEKWVVKNCDYAVIGREVGEGGTPHLQIHLEFKTLKSLKQMKELNKKWHCEPRIGTKEQASNYCKKDGKFFEHGTIENEQGKRTDINIVKEAVKKGATMMDVAELTNSYQAIRYAQTLRTIYQKPRSWKTEVYWMYGKTGTGKSRRAFDMCGDPYVCMDTMKWWDGYDGHDDVIIDDFRPMADCQLKYLLRLLDRYPFRVECKGGSTQFLAKRVFITTNYGIERSFANGVGEDIKQLRRRVEHTWNFKGQTCPECSRILYKNELCDCFL